MTQPLTRRRFGEFAILGTLAATGIGSLSSCAPTSSPADTPGSERPRDTVSVAMTASSEPSAGFNPIYGWGCGEHVHEPLIQSTLITTTTDLTFANDLATDYSSSDDGLVWSFTIRDDVKFSDGTRLTARDVAFTINAIKDSTGAVADLTMVDQAVAQDDTHVEIHLNKPFNALLYTLAVVGIIPEASYSDDYGEAPIGSGRYLLERWDKGEQAIFVANPDYYGPPPTMQRVVVVFMAEDAALAGVRAGEIDIVYTSAVYSTQQVAGYELLSITSVDSRGISLPTGAPGGTLRADGIDYPEGNSVTSDLAVRRALNLAVDRELMVANVLNGHGTVAYTVADGTPWASTDMAVTTDRAAAAKLLDEAGWRPRASDGVRVKDGVAAELVLYYAASDSTRQALAAEFASQMAEIGIKVTPSGKSWDEIYARQYADPVLWGWGSNSPSELYNLLYSTGWGNFPNYVNPVVDAHLDAALAQAEVTDSYADYQLAQWDGQQGVGPQGAATWVWLANIDHLYFARQGLNIAAQKLHPHGHGWSLVNNVDQWTWA